MDLIFRFFKHLDPPLLFKAFLSESAWHRLVKLLAVLILLFFLAGVLRAYPAYRLKLLWGLEVLIYLLLILAFVIRRNPQIRAVGVKEILLPYLASLLPFTLRWFPLSPQLLRVSGLVWGLEGLMALGAGLTILGIISLGRSYGISVAVRQPVTGGIYRYLRHPVYLGEFISYLGVMVFHFCWQTVGLYLIFVLLQLIRASLEEAKLSANFPEYQAYREKTPFLFPRLH